jgi:hypothetical protein
LNFSYANITCSRLKKIDDLWYYHSDGQFGFQVQQDIQQDISQEFGNIASLTGEEANYLRFLYAVGWITIPRDMTIEKIQSWSEGMSITTDLDEMLSGDDSYSQSVAARNLGNFPQSWWWIDGRGTGRIVFSSGTFLDARGRELILHCNL